MKRLLTATVLLAILIAAPTLQAAEFKVHQHDDQVDVMLDGKLFTSYLTRSGAKPILFPLVGPTGAEVTRGYPMRKATAAEKSDHVHHRSFWFTHGDVNGISFWHENGEHGVIEHEDFTKLEATSESATIATKNKWLGPNGKLQCTDTRSFTFGTEGNGRYIDAEITVTAAEGGTTFGDTKEGSFGVRTAGSMKVDSKQGGKIVNSEGQTDKEAWGKPAAWVDYHGPADGKTVGITIMNHPSSFRFPTHWHVRTYGLFAANPFGYHDFKSPLGNGTHKMKAGESFTLRYRVYLHEGDEKQGHVAKVYEAYKAKKFE
jgi:hypothetical protein